MINFTRLSKNPIYKSLQYTPKQLRHPFLLASLRRSSSTYRTQNTKSTTIKMVNVRQATARDLLDMQTTNLWCLPENYQVRFASAPLFVGCSAGCFSFRASLPQIFLIELFSDEVLLLSFAQLAAIVVGRGGF